MFQDPSLSRRGFLRTAAGTSAAVLLAGSSCLAHTSPASTPQRICLVLLDGFGTDYYEQSHMPTLKEWARNGSCKSIRGVMPSVTNTNVTGLCCGVHADEHGITANSFYDAETDREHFMSESNLVTAATLFQRAGRFGVRSALV